MNLENGDKSGMGDRIDEEFTAARLYISKLKSEVKAIADKCHDLQSGQFDQNAHEQESSKELADTQLALQQHEAKLKALQQQHTETETKKRALEEQLDRLTGGAGATAEGQAVPQMSQLRDEIAVKEKELTEVKVGFRVLNGVVCKDTLQAQLADVELAHAQLKNEHAKLQEKEAAAASRLKELSSGADKREQAASDLKGLEETVGKELQTLHQLRKIFVSDLQQRVKRTPTGPDEDEFVSSAAQKQKIAFLENNLDQLTKVHKQVSVHFIINTTNTAHCS